jgi:short-subunit dehydrogenase
MPQPPISRPLALITGASSGIGAAFARAYAKRGYDVAIVARRLDRLESLAIELRNTDRVEAFPIAADLSIWEAEKPVLAALEALGRSVDVLVNNAGFGVASYFLAVPWARQRDGLMTMVVSATALTHALLPAMVERGRGSVINVGSLTSFSPGAASHTLYPGIKTYALRFSQALDAELRAKGIRVTCVCPGLTETEFADVSGAGEQMKATPRIFSQTATSVAEAAIVGNEKGHVIVVPAWHDKIAALLLRYLPEPLVRAAIRVGMANFKPEP